MKKSSVRPKLWTMLFLAAVAAVLGIVGALVVIVDPFFHYHKPYTDVFYYNLNNSRSQNDGITKHFDYDALITGTSMTQNFKTSEMDALFGTNAIKVPYAGGSYKEINDNLAVAAKYNPRLKIVVRGLDSGKICNDKDSMRYDLGAYPTYLYDDNVLNDVEYIFNRDVVFSRVIPMALRTRSKVYTGGIDSFDSYSYWGNREHTYGIKAVCPEGVPEMNSAAPPPPTHTHICQQTKRILCAGLSGRISQPWLPRILTLHSIISSHPTARYGGWIR